MLGYVCANKDNNCPEIGGRPSPFMWRKGWTCEERSESKVTGFASRLRRGARLVWVRLTFVAHTSGCPWEPRVEVSEGSVSRI